MGKTNLVHREPLTSDIIFKAVFGSDTPESKAALAKLLNFILEKDNDPIVDIIYKNPFNIATTRKEKEIIMDIKVETSSGELIDIEMQVGDLEYYINRSLYYGCSQLARSLAKGADYGTIKPSIVISFVDGKLFPDKNKFYSMYTLRERSESDELTDLLQYHYIELGKVDWSKRDPDCLSPLERLCAYFKCSGKEDESEFVEELVQKGGEVISMTDNILRKVSEDELVQQLREDIEMGKMIVRAEKRAAREKGLAEGLAEGRAKGRAEGRAEGRADEKKILPESLNLWV